MRRKLVWMLWVAAALGLVLTGCGQQRTQASYIGADAAKAIALDAAGIAEGAATFASADLENRNGTDYYQVTFTADGQNYAYDIDAVTGVVISGTQNGGTGGGADASGTETAAVGEGQGDCPEPRRPDRGSGHLCPEPPGLGGRPPGLRRGVLHQRLQRV